ncbi:MAG: ABC transporter permease [Gemmatimonadetes bacterium]|nr:ABC transporter permease [Gemmatimonadota bacterium]
MASPSAWPTRLHARLVRVLVPSLGADYAEQASVAFADMHDELREGPFRLRVRFWRRELGALLTTAVAERRAAKGGGPRPPRRSRPRWQGAVDVLGLDVRYAARNLLREPGFAAVVVVSLTLGISITTALFSIANAMLFRRAPHIEAPEELVTLYVGKYGNTSYPDFLDFREQTDALEDVAVFSTSDGVLELPGHAPRRAILDRVSDNYFDMLGVSIPYGRGFVTEDAETGMVAVVSHAMWQRDLGGAADVLGQSIEIEGRAYTIVGVAPAGLLSREIPVVPEAWYPIETKLRDLRGTRSLHMVGRMRLGVTVSQVQAQVDLIARRLFDEYPELWSTLLDEPQAVTVLSELEARLPPDDRGAVMGVLTILMVIVTLVLAIACSNVANLLLTRASRRRTEIAVRVALGAGRRRLVTQLLTESVLLAGTSAGLAFLLIHWVTDLFASGQLAFGLPMAIDVGVDWHVAVFAGLVGIGTGIAFGLVPALQASRPDLVPALKGLGESGRAKRFGARNLLVVAQVAGSLVLLVGATLFLRSLQEAAKADLGFDPHDVAVIRLDLEQGQYTPEAGAQFYADLLQRLRGIPWVEAAALGFTVPLAQGGLQRGMLQVEGYEPAAGENVIVAQNVVTPGYFELIGMPLVAGRQFHDADRDGAPGVVIVNEAFAGRFWPGEDPLGKRVESWEVVGVVRNAKYRTLGEELRPHIWTPYAQGTMLAMRVHVRTAGDVHTRLSALVRTVRAMDADLPIVNPSAFEDLVRQAVLPQRIMSVVLSVAGILALGMAVMGIYGVMAYTVSQRTREVGLRVALGAHPRRVVSMIVREGIALSSAGILVGVVLASLLTQGLTMLLYGVTPLDSVALLGGVAVLVVAATAASFVPALRASRVSPMEALRAE